MHEVLAVQTHMLGHQYCLLSPVPPVCKPIARVAKVPAPPWTQMPFCMSCSSKTWCPAEPMHFVFRVVCTLAGGRTTAPGAIPGDDNHHTSI